MQRVTGIGGIFFKCDNPDKVKEWYGKHLGLPISPYGSLFKWRDFEKPNEPGTTSWGLFKKDTKYFDPSKQEYMINYRVKNLESLLAEFKKEGVEQVGEMESFEYGKFAWIIDCEGNKIELWEPVDEPFLDEK